MLQNQLPVSVKRSHYSLFSISKCTPHNFLCERPESSLVRAAHNVFNFPESLIVKRPRPESRLVKRLAEKVLAAETRHNSETKLENVLIKRQAIEANQDWKLEYKFSLVRSLLKASINIDGKASKSPPPKAFETSNSPETPKNPKPLKPLKYNRLRTKRKPVHDRPQSDMRRTQRSQSNSSMSEFSPWLKPRYIPEKRKVKRLSPMR